MTAMKTSDLVHQRCNPEPDRSDILENSALFDGDWYRSTYRDVSLSGVPSALHYLWYGQWMERGISEAHQDPSTFAALTAALRRTPDISYCIPVMHRSEEIRETLAANLSDNRSLQRHVEFVVIFFDDERATHDWVRTAFASDISCGYLRLIVSDELKAWHFGRAKNAFKGRLSGEVYSSLDADNFVSVDETRQLLDISNKHGHHFVFHHFSGTWGDGSSGRVSVPSKLYESVGYDANMLPRQYDENDLILSTLIRHPYTTLVRYGSSNHLFSTKLSSTFAREAGHLPRRCQIVDPVKRRAPLNPRGDSYILDNPEVRAMHDFNQHYSYWKNLQPGALRNRYLEHVYKCRHLLIDCLPREKLIPTIISSADSDSLPKLRADEVCLFSCVKNDHVFLQRFYTHYTSIGISRFFIVDDASDIPVSKTLPYPNVHVFKPQAGTFVTAKALWLEALIKYFVKPDSWVLTVDADEFLDIVPDYRSITDLTTDMQTRGVKLVPALSLDMLPNKTSDAPVTATSMESFARDFSDHSAAPGPATTEYTKHASIKWGFGEYADLSWGFDARYHAYGTFDSLRKIPLFRYRPGLHLNQGFHDLHYTDKSLPVGNEIWAGQLILPLRHYKLAKLFSEHLRADALKLGTSMAHSPYHPRTAQNIAKIFSGDDGSGIKSLLSLPRAKYSPDRFKKCLVACCRHARPMRIIS